MKEGLRRVRGTNLPTDIGEITLIDTFREEYCEYDQLYFTTEHDSITVKVYDLEKEESQDRFRHQEEVYLSELYDQLAEPLTMKEIQIKKNPFGLIVLKIAKGSTLKETAHSLNYQDWLSLSEFAIGFIEKLKNQNQVYLNFNPSNISKNSFGQLKITDPEFLSPQGSYQDLSSSQEQLIDSCEKEYLYRAPQLLDQYSKGKIDYKSDLYSFAIVLYQLIYHQYPFQSKLAQINCNYRPFPEETFFSTLISKILRPYHLREPLENLKTMLQTERKKVPKELNIKALNSGSTAQSKSGGIFSGITQMFSKLTTETESWYLNFTQNDDSVPEEKYLNLIVNKLFKKETKLEKLHLVMLKYLQQGTIPREQNRFLKTVTLIIQLFRRGPHISNYQWGEVLDLIEEKSSGNNVLNELCQFCRKKIAFIQKYKSIFRGNFFIEDLSKFKHVNVDILQDLQNYLSWVSESLKTKFLFINKTIGIYDYIKELYCDEIIDAISMLIFSVLCLRKDNELKLRKDPIERIGEIEKKINSQLKKISYLSNHFSQHAIYSLEAEYFYYQEEIQIRQNPTNTTLQHFYKYSRKYKGLCVPQNYALNYSSGDHKQFLSSENNRSDKSPEHKQKNYFIDDEEQYQYESSFKMPDQQSPGKKEIKKKMLQILREKPKEVKVHQDLNIFQLKNIKSDSKQEDTKKTVTFDDFFKVEPKPVSEPHNKNINFFDMGKKAEIKKNKTNDDFAFFDAFVDDKEKKSSDALKKDKKDEQIFNNFFENLGLPKLKESRKEKSLLSGSSSQKIFQQSFGKMKKSSVPISSPQKSKPKSQIDPNLLTNILSGLKLKELKEMILSNQQIIIDYDKLKLDKVIGSGSAGQVYVGKYNNETLAIKKVKTKENPNALKEFQRELVTYIKIKRNPFLVSLVGLSKEGENYYLLTQFCSSGSLFDLLHKKANTVALSWKQRISLAVQIAKGMTALHEMKPQIIHRDLKSLNVFVSQTNGVFTAKVADFGLSRSPQAEMMTMYLGTLHWMAPELLDNKQYSNKVDIYSFAVVLWEICSRKTPYNELSSPMAIIKHVTMEKKRPNLSLIPPDCPPDLTEIMKACWSHEPNDRPSFNEIIQKLQKINLFF